MERIEQLNKQSEAQFSSIVAKIIEFKNVSNKEAPQALVKIIEDLDKYVETQKDICLQNLLIRMREYYGQQIQQQNNKDKRREV